MFLALHPTLYLSGVFTFAFPNGSFYDYWENIVVTVVVSQGIAQMCSIWVDAKKATLVTVVIIMVLMLLSGFVCLVVRR